MPNIEHFIPILLLLFYEYLGIIIRILDTNNKNVEIKFIT
jgi:hypothetical protein